MDITAPPDALTWQVLAVQVADRLSAARDALAEARGDRYRTNDGRDIAVGRAQRRVRELEAEVGLVREGRLAPRFALRGELAGGAYRVREDDGVVTDVQSRDVLWLDCPCCGTRPPVLSHRTEEPVMYGNGGIGWTRVGTRVRYEVDRLAVLITENPRTGKRQRDMAQRCECGWWGRLRLIRHVGVDGRGRERGGVWYCSSACLNGQRTCDCRCAGRCHGRGVCEGH